MNKPKFTLSLWDGTIPTTKIVQVFSRRLSSPLKWAQLCPLLSLTYRTTSHMFHVPKVNFSNGVGLPRPQPLTPTRNTSTRPSRQGAWILDSNQDQGSSWTALCLSSHLGPNCLGRLYQVQTDPDNIALEVVRALKSLHTKTFKGLFILEYKIKWP